MIQDKEGCVLTVLQAIISGMFQLFQGEIPQKHAFFLQLGLWYEAYSLGSVTVSDWKVEAKYLSNF